MNRLFLPVLTLLFLASCSPKVAPVVGEDGTDWNARAAEYRDNPAALRDFVEDCERNEQQLASLQQEQRDFQTQRDELQQQLATAETSSEQAYQEIQTLRQQVQNLESRRSDEMITDQPAMQVKGVIFQVQLGAYAQEQNKVEADMATGDALDLTDQNGMQKVVVSRFRTYQNAANLRDRLQKMGVKGAFVVAMNDGQRIDVQEAIRLAGQ